MSNIITLSDLMPRTTCPTCNAIIVKFSVNFDARTGGKTWRYTCENGHSEERPLPHLPRLAPSPLAQAMENP